MVSKAIQSAQTQMEQQNFEIRKNVLKYDEVMNKQREVIYAERRKILEGRDLKDEALDWVAEVVNGTVAKFVSKEIYPEEWDLEGLLTALTTIYPVTLTKDELEELVTAEEVAERIVLDAIEAYERKEKELGTDPESGTVVLRELERMVLLSLLDNQWREHLYEMDYLQEGIGLRAYGQRDPLVEYQREAFAAYEELQNSIREEFVRYVYRVELIRQDEPQRPRPQRVVVSRGDEQGGGQGEGQIQGGGQAAGNKIPRNAPCPCGSGKKYKKCHGLSA